VTKRKRGAQSKRGEILGPNRGIAIFIKPSDFFIAKAMPRVGMNDPMGKDEWFPLLRIIGPRREGRSTGIVISKMK
jgi:hypothetical protein